MNLLLLTNFYPVISYRRGQKESDELFVIYDLATRYDPWTSCQRKRLRFTNIPTRAFEAFRFSRRIRPSPIASHSLSTYFTLVYVPRRQLRTNETNVARERSLFVSRHKSRLKSRILGWLAVPEVRTISPPQPESTVRSNCDAIGRHRDLSRAQGTNGGNESFSGAHTHAHAYIYPANSISADTYRKAYCTSTRKNHAKTISRRMPIAISFSRYSFSIHYLLSHSRSFRHRAINVACTMQPNARTSESSGIERWFDLEDRCFRLMALGRYYVDV